MCPTVRSGTLGNRRSRLPRKRNAKSRKSRTRVAPASPGRFHGTIAYRSRGAKYPKSSPPAIFKLIRGNRRDSTASGMRERMPSTAFVDSEVSRLITTRNRSAITHRRPETNLPETKNPPERRLGRVRINGLSILPYSKSLPNARAPSPSRLLCGWQKQYSIARFILVLISQYPALPEGGVYMPARLASQRIFRRTRYEFFRRIFRDLCAKKNCHSFDLPSTLMMFQ